MANPDYEFLDGYDKYGALSSQLMATLMTQGEWTSNLATAQLLPVASLGGTGFALQVLALDNSTLTLGVKKTLPSNYARALGGHYIQYSGSVSGRAACVTSFWDGATCQLSIGINSAGNIQVNRGDFNTGTSLGTSSVAVDSSIHVIEYDITIHNTTGIVKVWLDGILTSLNLTGQNTRAGSNNYYNVFHVGAYASALFPVTSKFDHTYLWCYTASGGSETPALTNAYVETEFVTADSAVAFTFGAAVFGQAYQQSTSTNAPAANSIILRKFTADVNGTIGSINVLPGATSAGAKFKGIIYSDSGGAAGTLLSSGTEVVGCTSGTILNLPLVTPQSLVAGTAYWVGLINDTSVALGLTYTDTVGYRAANTYTSGAPGTAPGMTSGQSSWMIYGTVTGVTTNWNEVGKNPPLGLLSYVKSATNNAEDLYDVTNLVSTPSTIYTLAVKVHASRLDTGARSIQAEVKSSSTTSAGASASVPASFSWFSGYFRTDPNTSAAWTGSGVNAAKIGFKLGNP